MLEQLMIPGCEMTQTDEQVRYQVKVDQWAYGLKEQCDQCKLGDKPIGPKSGCEVKKKLVVDKSHVGWKHKHLFFDNLGTCKMYQPK